MARRGEYGRRGLSPLIATVLLIAFAAAIGTMIMNWSLHSDDPVEPDEDVCEDIAITLEELPGGEAMCYDAQTKQVRFVVVNSGTKTIPSVFVTASSVVNGSFNTGSKELQPNMAPGDTVKFNLEYDTGSPTGVTAKILPVANDPLGTRCVEKEIKKVSLPPC